MLHNQSTEMKLVTVVNNEQHAGFRMWRESARVAGWSDADVVVLNPGSGFKFGHSTGGFFGIKLKLMREWLRSLPPDEGVLFTDGFDVVVLAGPAQFATWCLQFPAHVMFAAEKFENPDQNLHPYFLRHISSAPFLNSGVYMGCAEKLLQLLSSADHSIETDDQRYFTRALFAEGSPIKLDHTNIFFACMAGVERSEIALSLGRDRIVFKHTLNTPGVLHYQGFYRDTLYLLPQLDQFKENAVILRGLSELQRSKSSLTPFYDAVARLGSRLRGKHTSSYPDAFIGGLAICLVCCFAAAAVVFKYAG